MFQRWSYHENPIGFFRFDGIATDDETDSSNYSSAGLTITLERLILFLKRKNTIKNPTVSVRHVFAIRRPQPVAIVLDPVLMYAVQNYVAGCPG